MLAGIFFTTLVTQSVVRLGYGLEERDSVPGRCSIGIFFSSPWRPDRLWGPPTLLTSYRGFLSRRYSDRIVKLITHLHLMLRSRMRGAVPPLPHYVFMMWCLI